MRGSKRKLASSGSEIDLSLQPRASKKRVKHRKLDLMAFPYDIFEHIAKCCHPASLLQLSRSCRTLRDHLMRRNAEGIWKAAEMLIGLPECPSDMTSPQYACLLFGKNCMHCHSATRSKHLLGLRIRLCTDCFKENIQSAFDVPSVAQFRLNNVSGDLQSLLSIVPSYRHVGRSRDKIQPGNLRLDFLVRAGYRSVFYVPCFEAAFKYYSSLQTEAEKKEYLSKQRQRTAEILFNTKAMLDWVDEDKKAQKKARADDRILIAKRREEDILHRLRDSGFKEEDFESVHDKEDETKQWKAIIGKSEKLTEKGWGKIRPKLEEIINKRREKAFIAVFQKRLDDLAEIVKRISNTKCIVSFESAQQLPLVQRLLTDRDSSVSFNGPDAAALEEDLTKLGTKWIYDLQEYCATSFRESWLGVLGGIAAPVHADPDEVCKFATAFFVVYQWKNGAPSHIVTYSELIKDILEAHRRDPSEYDYRTRVKAAPVELIKALYEDSTMATMSHDQLARGYYKFACLRCSSSRLAEMSWPALIRHYYKLNRENAERLGSWEIALHSVSPSCHAEVQFGGLVGCWSEWISGHPDRPLSPLANDSSALPEDGSVFEYFDLELFFGNEH